jgi:hypothetical protein
MQMIHGFFVATFFVYGTRLVAKKMIKYPLYKQINSAIPLNQVKQAALLSGLAYKKPSELLDSEKVPNYPIFFNNDTTDSQAYIWAFEKTVFVVFRGTNDFYDLKCDVDIRCHDMSKGIKVHNGFYSQFKSIDESIRTQLATMEFDTLIVTGHSSGAACASIAAPLYAELYVTKNIQVNCYTFGCPRVGNMNFVKWFESLVNLNVRVINADDPVPMMPFSRGFVHVSNGVCLSDDGLIQQIFKDIPWFLRPVSIIGNLDLNAPFKDHPCKLYVERLDKII